MNSVTNLPITTKMLDRMEEKILKNRPQLKEIKRKYGSMSYFEYVKQKNRVNTYKHFQERKKEIIAVIKEETLRLLGSSIAESIEEQLKKNDSVSTAEHTAPIGTSHMLSSGLSVSVPLFSNSEPKYQNIIILSCSGPSFNNNLSFGRGFQFHVFHDGKIIDNQIAFFGRSVDSKTVLYNPAYSKNSVLEIKKNISDLKLEGNLGTKEFESIQNMLDEIYLSPHALSAADYPDQLAITNYYFWRKLFPSFKPEEIPNYVMLSQEKIVIKLLLKYHIDVKTPINKFLFNKEYWLQIEKYFEGITGAFNTKESLGTFLFWAVLKDGSRKRMIRKEGILTTMEGDYKVNLKPDDIKQALLNHEIFPGMLLTFTVLSFYYGFLLGGGASQPTYLTQMKEKYIEMMEELGDIPSANDARASVTDDFVFFRPHLAFIEVYGQRVSATGLDMYLYNDSIWKRIIHETQSITMNEFITILLPILYKQFCADDKKEEDLMNINRQDVEEFIGFSKKLSPLKVIV